MEKKKMTAQQKKRLILIVTCLIAFIIIILFIFKMVVNKNTSTSTDIEDTKKLSGVFIVPGTVETPNYTIGTEKCAGNICVFDIQIEYHGDRGLITYVVANDYTDYRSGNLRVVLDGKKFVFPYSVEAVDTKTFYYGYDGYEFDFDNFGGFYVESGGVGDSASMFDNIPISDRPSIHVN